MKSIEKNISDLTDKEIKGIDMAFKALKKTYPFIKGWELYHKEPTYSSIIFVSAIIDIQETANYIKSEVIPFWYEESKSQPLHSYSIGPYFKNMPNEEDIYSLRNNIEDKLKSLYDSIPDDFRIINQMESFTNEPFTFNVHISIFNYIHINPNK